ncbi:hypothetical protein D3C78_1755040 [compost metagenome]
MITGPCPHVLSSTSRIRAGIGLLRSLVLGAMDYTPLTSSLLASTSLSLPDFAVNISHNNAGAC